MNNTGNPATDSTRSKCLVMFHCNVRSLPKNLSLLSEFLYSANCKPDILAITETRLSTWTVTNVDIPNYDFLHINSPTQAGGSGLYVSKNLNAIYRPDLKFSIPLVESSWCEIILGNGRPNVIVRCIYQCPTSNLSAFTSEFETLLKEISEHEIYILGDFNIDLLKYSEHLLTEECLNMLYLNNLLPLITKPTRLTHHTSTLIDHISDHLLVFCLLDRQISRSKRALYFLDYSKFDVDQYIKDVDAVDWINVCNDSNDTQEEAANCISILKQIAGKHAPIKHASQSKRRQLAKPWLTRGILISVTRKQK